jgi:hypothetical protein
MAHTLDADTYIDAHCQPKWENAMVDEYHSLMKHMGFSPSNVRNECNEMSMGRRNLHLKALLEDIRLI